MTRRSLIYTSTTLFIILVSLAVASAQGPEAVNTEPLSAVVGTTFTYQGHLEDAGAPANGTYDFEFRLYNAPTAGSQVGDPVMVDDWPVANGIFTVDVDFGSGAFNGDARWLEVSLRPGASVGTYTTLAPRQALTPAPYAMALPGLWTQPNTESPNLIGGYSGNSVTGGAVGATIGGGGSGAPFPNRVTDDYGTVGGGQANRAGDSDAATHDASHATVGGGHANVAGGILAAVGGGYSNGANAHAATVAGGFGNVAGATFSAIGGGLGNHATASFATISGGGSTVLFDTDTSNRVTDDYGSVGGGGGNQAGNGDEATDDAVFATVSGGETNAASGKWSTVGGGFSNSARAINATIGGGHLNTATGASATVAGGFQNDATGGMATVGGGLLNNATGTLATIGGGEANVVDGDHATVPGGFLNVAGGDYSLAAGRQAEANHHGSFVWADSTGAAMASTGDNQFVARASGGVWFYSDSDATSGVHLAAGAGSWASLSDRDAKTAFRSVDGREILTTLATLPISTWRYKSQDPSIRHIGPVAQDFYAAFGVGADDRHISTVDADGVALAAIQELHQVVQAQAGRITVLEAENAASQQQIATLEARLVALEQMVDHAGAPVPAVQTRPHLTSTTNTPAGLQLAGGLILIGLVLRRRWHTRGKR